ncbi:MAG: thioredoxin domain-containing protein [Deltaproteobacteria bacterium]|nr:thioredoxin domain-containing protein [Deltaproteobacteria bacterium]
MAALLSGCENKHSRLNDIPAPKTTDQATPERPDPSMQPTAALGQGTLEERVAALEARLNKSKEALDFLDMAYQQQKQQAEQKERAEPAPDAIFAVNIDDNLKMGLVKGPLDAPVTIVDAFDFACPYCRKVSTTLEELVKEYNGKVRVVMMDMVVHPPQAMPGHLASCAAAKQGKYAKFENAFWEKAFDPYAAARDPSKLGEDNIYAIAGEIGLDVEKLKVDMKGEECKKHIAEDMAELAKFNVNSTPTLYINGTVIGGALPKEAFKEIIDAKLKQVEASGVKPGEYYDKEIMAKGEKKFRSKLDPKPH